MSDYSEDFSAVSSPSDQEDPVEDKAVAPPSNSMISSLSEKRSTTSSKTSGKKSANDAAKEAAPSLSSSSRSSSRKSKSRSRSSNHRPYSKEGEPDKRSNGSKNSSRSSSSSSSSRASSKSSKDSNHSNSSKRSRSSSSRKSSKRGDSAKQRELNDASRSSQRSKRSRSSSSKKSSLLNQERMKDVKEIYAPASSKHSSPSSSQNSESKSRSRTPASGKHESARSRSSSKSSSRSSSQSSSGSSKKHDSAEKNLASKVSKSGSSREVEQPSQTKVDEAEDQKLASGSSSRSSTPKSFAASSSSEDREQKWTSEQGERQLKKSTHKKQKAKKRRRHAKHSDVEASGHNAASRRHHRERSDSSRGVKIPENDQELKELHEENEELKDELFRLHRDRLHVEQRKKRSECRGGPKDAISQMVQEAIMEEYMAQLYRSERKSLLEQRRELKATIQKHKKGLRYKKLIAEVEEEINEAKETHRDLLLEVRYNEKLLVMNANMMDSGEGVARLNEDIRAQNALTQRELQHSIRDLEETEKQRDILKDQIEELRKEIERRRALLCDDDYADEIRDLREEIKLQQQERKRLVRVREKEQRKAKEQQPRAFKEEMAEKDYLDDRIFAMRAELDQIYGTKKADGESFLIMDENREGPAGGAAAAADDDDNSISLAAHEDTLAKTTPRSAASSHTSKEPEKEVKAPWLQPGPARESPPPASNTSASTRTLPAERKSTSHPTSAPRTDDAPMWLGEPRQGSAGSASTEEVKKQESARTQSSKSSAKEPENRSAILDELLNEEPKETPSAEPPAEEAPVPVEEAPIPEPVAKAEDGPTEDLWTADNQPPPAEEPAPNEEAGEGESPDWLDF